MTDFEIKQTSIAFVAGFQLAAIIAFIVKAWRQRKKKGEYTITFIDGSQWQTSKKQLDHILNSIGVDAFIELINDDGNVYKVIRFEAISHIIKNK